MNAVEFNEQVSSAWFTKGLVAFGRKELALYGPVGEWYTYFDGAILPRGQSAVPPFEGTVAKIHELRIGKNHYAIICRNTADSTDKEINDSFDTKVRHIWIYKNGEHLWGFSEYRIQDILSIAFLSDKDRRSALRKMNVPALEINVVIQLMEGYSGSRFSF